MRPVVAFCLRFPRLILLAALAITAVGVFAAVNARYDVFPQFGQPTVVIDTSVPGLAAEQIEGLVTTPVEDAVNGIPGLVALRSQSMTGLSVVNVVFDGDTDIYRDRQLVAERLAPLAGTLPEGATPVIAPLRSSTGDVLTVGLSSPTLSLMQLTEIARGTMRPALLSVPGVSDVVIFGARPEQLQVQFDPDRIIEAGISLDQLATAARQASAVLGAGMIETPNQQVVIQAYGQTLTPRDLADSLVVQRDGRSIRLGDVARVVPASPPAFSGALVGPHPGVLVVISAQYGADLLGVTEALDRELAILAPALKRDGVVLLPDALRPASFVLTALQHLRDSLIIGAVLILAVLFLALRNWRTAIISFVAIPLSLLMAIIALNWLGFSLNTMSLGGLAIAIGEVVDDAVVDVENIHRRLRENRGRPDPRPPLRVVLDASLEVRGSILFATLAVAIVFLPLLGLSGVAGRLFAPLGVAYIAAIVSSLVVALTITPALAWLLLGRAPLHPADPPLVARAKRGYGRLLSAVGRHPGLTLGSVAGMVIVSFASVPFMRTEFLPAFHERQFILHFETAPGTSLDAMLGIGERATRILQQMPEVASVVLHAGHADLSNEHAGTNKAEMDVTLTPEGGAQGEALQARILATVRGVPGVRWTANTFLVERIHETLSGQTAPIVITVFGPSLTELDGDAARISAALQKIPGANGVSVAAPPGRPEVSVVLDRAVLLQYGLTAGQVLGAIRTSYTGDTVGRVYSGSRSFPIVVVLPPGLRADPAALGAVPLTTATGGVVRLDALAHIQAEAGRDQILHAGARRVQVVTVNVPDSDASAFVARAREVLSELQLAPGNYISIGGTATASGRAQLELILHSFLALAAIIGLLVIALGQSRLVALLLVNVPLALIGGIAAVWVAGLTVSLGAAVGFVTVFGITLRNALMLLSRYRALVLAERSPWSVETARVGAMDRLSPILITACVTALGLLPIALGSNLSGQEIQGPMAIVILGGLCSSTLLTLLVLPLLAIRFAHIEGRKPLARVRGRADTAAYDWRDVPR
jgi:CzcA family heavy metal efflux pump